MRVFISWSGEPSRRVAELLRWWIPTVIQEVTPFVSSQDIARGTRNMVTIGQELAETDFGVIVLTPQNAAAPWINFEAGALSKNLVSGHVIPILCEIQEVALAGSPLRQFQWSYFERDQMLSVISSINNACTLPLDAIRLEQSFAAWWPTLEESYAALRPLILADAQNEAPLSEQQIGNVLVSILNDLTALRRDASQQALSMKQLSDRMSAQNSFENLGGLGGLGGMQNSTPSKSSRPSLGDILGMHLKAVPEEVAEAARAHAASPPGDP